MEDAERHLELVDTEPESINLELQDTEALEYTEALELADIGILEYTKALELADIGILESIDLELLDQEELERWIGASRHLSVASFQIDRGIFENFLAAEVPSRGLRLIEGAIANCSSSQPA